MLTIPKLTTPFQMDRGIAAPFLSARRRWAKVSTPSGAPGRPLFQPQYTIVTRPALNSNLRGGERGWLSAGGRFLTPACPPKADAPPAQRRGIDWPSDAPTFRLG